MQNVLEIKEGIKVFLTLSFLLCGRVNCQVSSLQSVVQLTLDDGGTIKLMRCGFTQSVPDTHIIYMSIQGSDLCDSLDSYSSLAHINLWTKEPVLDAVDSAINVSGGINSDDFSQTFLSIALDVDMKSPNKRSFKCVAQGINLKGQPVTATKTIRDGACISNQVNELKLKTGLLGSTINTLEDKIELIDAAVKEDSIKTENLNTTMNRMYEKLELVDITTKRNSDDVFTLNASLDGLGVKMKALDTTTRVFSHNITVFDSRLNGNNDNILTLNATVNGMNEEMVALTSTVKENRDTIMKVNATMKGLEALYTMVREFLDNFEIINTTVKDMKSEMEELKGKIDLLQNSVDSVQDKFQNSRVLDIESSGFYTPSTSNVFNNQLYLFSKNKTVFDIESANTVCHSLGGYLVEFNTLEDYDFINNIVHSMDQDYCVDYTDRGTEGKFVHVESGNELKRGNWREGEPNDYLNDEDCVQIHRFGDGLNDLPCSSYECTYICQVRL